MGLTEDIMHKAPHYLAITLLGLTAIVSAGCGDSTSTVPLGVPRGWIEITVSTVSAITDIDPDGYFLSIDQGSQQPVRADTTVKIGGFRLGTHLVALYGLASNCAVEGVNSRSVEVIDASIAMVAFAVTCLPPSSEPSPWDY